MTFEFSEWASTIDDGLILIRVDCGRWKTNKFNGVNPFNIRRPAFEETATIPKIAPLAPAFPHTKIVNWSLRRIFFPATLPTLITDSAPP